MTFRGEKSFPGLNIAAPVPACDLEVVEVDGGHYYEEEDDDFEDCTPDSEEDDEIDEDEAPEPKHVLRDNSGKPIEMNGKRISTPIPVSRISAIQKVKRPDWIFKIISPGITKEDEDE